MLTTGRFPASSCSPKLYHVLLVLALSVRLTLGQDCPVDIPGDQRRDCYPWVNANQPDCEARGCLWCELEEPGFPFCFYNDEVCPSVIAESERVDCHPEPDASRASCNQRGCVWCVPENAGIPACFTDESVSQGGATCPDDVADDERIDCHPEPDANEQTCLQRGCHWCQGSETGPPICFMPKQRGYRLVGEVEETPQGYTATLGRISTPSVFGGDVETIQMDVEYQTTQRLRVKFSDPSVQRWEVPIAIEGTGEKPVNTDYDVEFTTEPVFSFRVTRKSTDEVIFDTSIGGFEFADQFIQIATYLSSEKIYGFGEFERQTNLHDMNWRKWGMWTHDQATTDSNLYGQYPLYLNLEQSFAAHMMLFLNTNAQDVTLMPHPALTFRTIGGVLDMYFFMGDSPEEAVQQYQEALGKPVMPPYWALGFQLCRWGYSDLGNMKEAVDRMRQYDIPHDIQYGDIDYMEDAKDFTIDQVNFAGLPEYVQELKQQGTRFIIILDPGISNQQTPGTYPPFDRGQEQGVWIMEEDGVTPYEGEVWPGLVYYPDYTKQATEDWWVQECIDFKEELDYVGLWVDMNEPSSFIDGSSTGCADNRFNSPPYLPAVADFLWKKTLCMEAKQEAGTFYDVHSLYGWSMARASYRAAREATGLRSIAFTRSAFPGTGQWTQHWLGDNFSQWPNMAYSIIGMFDFNLFGMPYVGADICGFIGETNEELCHRWQEVGAFYPFSRNHNADGNPPQDPGIWPSVGATTSSILRVRYRLLPYLYTLFHHAHIQGGTVVRPLYFEFPNDPVTHSLDQQFLWGSAFLVSPVLEAGVVAVDAYFPDTAWYNFYDGAPVAARGETTSLDAPIDYIPLHVRGGYILPTQQPANSTMFSRVNPMGLLVALNDDGEASGDLFWDDGESQDTQESGEYFYGQYEVTSNTLSGVLVTDGYPDLTLQFQTFTVYGVAEEIDQVFINATVWDEWSYDPTLQVLEVTDAVVDVRSDFTVSWTFIF